MRLQDRIITRWTPQGSAVLELGCGNGDLLLNLVNEKKARAQGIEIDPKALRECIAKGLNVFQEDIEGGLPVFPDGAFDVVIMNECLQQVKKPDFVLNEALRVGRRAIVAFPNFAYYKVRFQVLFGRVPVTHSLPYEWYETPNLHFLSTTDFKEYSRMRGFTVERSAFISGEREVGALRNLLAQLAIFEITI